MSIESDAEFENDPMMDISIPPWPIDPTRARFPCCIVWTPLPVISWLIPFIGHIGICREDGVILDFAGPNFVCVDNFTFGAVTCYLQLSKEKCCLSPMVAEVELHDPCGKTGSSEISWDDALRKSTQEFQHRNYSLFTCNCHSFVANNLNRMCYGRFNKWNVVNLAVLMFFKGTWVSRTSALRSLLPFVLATSLGFVLGGLTFLIYLVGFASIVVSWFVIGTYCFKSVIQL